MQSRLEIQKCILARKKTLDEGASVFGKTMKRTKQAAGSLMTGVALVRRNYVKNLLKKTSDPIQSNPIQSNFFNKKRPNPIPSNPIQSMDESNPCPTLVKYCVTEYTSDSWEWILYIESCIGATFYPHPHLIHLLKSWLHSLEMLCLLSYSTIHVSRLAKKLAN